VKVLEQQAWSSFSETMKTWLKSVLNSKSVMVGSWYVLSTLHIVLESGLSELLEELSLKLPLTFLLFVKLEEFFLDNGGGLVAGVGSADIFVNCSKTSPSELKVPIAMSPAALHWTIFLFLGNVLVI
jgi:hypothetical protein